MSGNACFEQYVFDNDKNLFEFRNSAIQVNNIITKKNGEIETIEWTPEKPIIKNGYYIGSVDLYVLFKIPVSFDFICVKSLDKTIHKIENVYGDNFVIPLIFEFKPEMKSFSETLRQVKIYEQHIKGNYFVITNSDISKFQAIFESQGIKIYNTKE
jgi:hypothetical protein